MLRKTSNYLPLIIALALGLRLVGITHGFPFIFHPDEPTIVRSALGLRFDLNPGHFDWPHLYMYLNYFVYMVFAKFRDIIALLGYKEYTYFVLPLIWDDELIFYVITRSFSALLGALTVIPVYLTAKKIFGQRAGWLAGLALAITPFHVWHSHYSLPDVPMIFFLTLALYFMSGLLFKKKTSDYLLAGLFIGLAATIKYNGALMAGGLVLAHLIRVLSEKHEKLFDVSSWQNLIFSGVCSVVGFVLGTPYAVLDYETFIRTDGPKGALWQFTNVGSVDFFTHAKQFLSVMVYKLPENFGYTMLILFVAAFIFTLLNVFKNRKLWGNKDLLFFTLFGMGLIFYVAGLEKTRAHYFFISYPVVIIGSVGFLLQYLDKIKNRFKNLVWVIVFAFPLYFSLQSAYAFYQIDTRVLFYRWLAENMERIDKVYVLDKDLVPVFEKLGMDVYTTDVNYALIEKGSYVVSTKEESNNLEKVFDIDSALNRGPKINIYKPQNVK